MTETVPVPETAPAPPTDVSTPPTVPTQVQCEFCGKVQELDPGYLLCFNCGQALSPGQSRIIRNPRIGKGLQGTGIMLFFIFLCTFFFYSKFIGWNGMAISALLSLWGFYRGYRNRLEPPER